MPSSPARCLAHPHDAQLTPTMPSSLPLCPPQPQLAESESRLFKPSISDATDILLTARPDRLHESALERDARLAYVDKRRIEAGRAALEA
eukprot:3948750-Pleurochrysis_carterae.AAC.1